MNKKIIAAVVLIGIAWIHSCSLSEISQNTPSKPEQSPSQPFPGKPQEPAGGDYVSAFSVREFEVAFKQNNIRCNKECGDSSQRPFVQACKSNGGQVFEGTCCDYYCSKPVKIQWWQDHAGQAVYDKNKVSKVYSGPSSTCQFNPFSDLKFLESCFNARGSVLPDENCAPTICTADLNSSDLARGVGNRFSDHYDPNTSLWKTEGGFKVLRYVP